MVTLQMDNRLHYIHPFDHLAKNGVLTVEARVRVVHQEELAPRRVRIARARRAQDAWRVLDLIELLGELVARAAGAVRASIVGVAAVRASALNHESRDDAVEPDTIVEAFGDELLERGGMLGRMVGEELDDDPAVSGVQDGDRIASGGGGCAGRSGARESIGHGVSIVPTPDRRQRHEPGACAKSQSFQLLCV